MAENTSFKVTTKDITLPPRENIIAAMDIAKNSPEAANYLNEQIEKIVEGSRFLNKSKEIREISDQVVAAVKDFAMDVSLRKAPANIWNGEMPETSDFINLQKGIASRAIDKLNEESITGVRFDYAIAKDGHFVRGYGSTEDASPLEQEMVNSLDDLFNAWLAEQKILTEEGYLYHTTEEGEKGKQLKVDEVEGLFVNSAEGFKKYLEGKFELVAQQREYPGEEKIEEQKNASIENDKKATSKDPGVGGQPG